ncbi:hypothetical protein A2W32_01860 [candidate division WWE3 bacterium RBG_16_37_10]|uniref:Uncharacterized protein n=2 Tax=Bacteria candidate phyla TaxID=1783234 RepID=A0A1F4UXQ7_UNCKA|nr:MAG: hypothetical protein A2W32_01860 [candidate division WWE3 bacterium RBG_16_37_10]OGC91219.1 MAG: hypothetical protein A2V48_03705 [Candidatus Amesbacteria bacterium RBG_19FT_COMBO_48_16]OGM98366.1 MAG: hypothetical protein A2735_00850 [Candidatus Yanofskybacteria bacterium RIFCSPHIGHO2_01_FULL_41_21]
MSIKRQSYPIAAIDIQIVDDGKFADVAFLVDRHDFMEDIAKLRETWIGKTLLSNSKINDFINLERDINEAKHFWKHYFELRRIAKKYSLGATYVGSILAATISGIITDADYRTMLKEPILYGLPEDLQFDDDVTFTSHRVREVDELNQNKDTKAIGVVKRDRQWYWLYQQMGYKKLASTVGQTMETVRSAVNSYQDKLQTYHKVV